MMKMSRLIGLDFTDVILLFAGYSLLIDCCFGISQETQNAMRDFSKLRLEASQQQQPSSTMRINPNTTPKDFYYSNSKEEAATEAVDVVYKPNYHQDTSAGSMDYVRSPINNMHEENEVYDSNPNMGSLLPNMQMRPNDEDLGASTGYYASSPDNDNKNHPHSQMMRKQEGAHSGGVGGSDDHQDVMFVPVPPSPGFLAEIEMHDFESGTLNEKGMGGLFDSDDNENDNPDPDDYYGQRSNQHPEDNRDGKADMNNNRYNRYDYGDY